MSKPVLKNAQINITSPYEINNQIFIKRSVETELEQNEQNATNVETLKKYALSLIENAKEEASLIVRESQLEASGIFNDAKNKAEIIKEESYAKGYMDGYTKGELEGKNEYDELMINAKSLADKALKDYQLILYEAQNEIVSLAVAVAKKVIAQELKINNTVVISIVREVLSKTLEKKGIILEVSSNDYETVKNNIDVISTKEFGITEIEVKENMGLDVGDVLAKTSFGSINGSIDTKIDKITNAFDELKFAADEDALVGNLK